MQDSLQSKLRYARSLTGLSQEKFAQALDRSRSTIAQWEAEGDAKFKTSPSRDNLMSVARLAEVPLYFFENEAVPIPRDDAGIEINNRYQLQEIWQTFKAIYGDKPTTTRSSQSRGVLESFLEAVRLEVRPEKPDLPPWNTHGFDVGGMPLKATYADDYKVFYLLSYDWSGRQIKGFYETVGHLTVIGAFYPKLRRYIIVYMPEVDEETSDVRNAHRRKIINAMEKIGIQLKTVTRPSELAEIVLDDLPF